MLADLMYGTVYYNKCQTVTEPGPIIISEKEIDISNTTRVRSLVNEVWPLRIMSQIVGIYSLQRTIQAVTEPGPIIISEKEIDISNTTRVRSLVYEVWFWQIMSKICMCVKYH